MTVRITIKRLILAALLLAAAGLGFAWSGLFQISASSGHWPITDWFLHWTMRNSVRTHAAFQPAFEPADGKQLVSAAGHYRQACQVCHGAPGVAPSAVMARATPPAPDLSVTAREWSDPQLFWIVEHGVKYTGMPAWGAPGRRDEVARMAAFVRRLPGMTARQYRALTEVATGPDLPGLRPGLLATCTGCHGADGRGRGQGDIPILGGQNPAYLRASLNAYASGKRPSAVMHVAAAPLSADEIDRLSTYFAAMPGLSAAPSGAHPLLTKGMPARQLPACTNCHAPGKSYPVLYGQKPAYVAGRLNNWHGDPTVIDAHKSKATMAVIARRIPQEDIDGLAAAIGR
ncbi:MAG: c-type cytochrome [Sphingobium sp.]